MDGGGQHLVPIPDDIAELTGPLLLGQLFNWALFGCLTVQAYVYYLAFPQDRMYPTKALVISIYIFELLQVALITVDSFRNFGSRWGNMEELSKVGLVWFSVAVQGAIVAATGQIFYAWRIWVLSKGFWIPALIIVLALVQSIVGIYDASLAHRYDTWILVTTKLRKLTCVWLGGTALCDVIVTIAMTWCLWTSRSGWRQTNTIIMKIAILVVESGMLCATVAVVELILFLLYPRSNYHLTPGLILSKLYSNSLFAVLNARVRIFGGRTGEDSDRDSTLSTAVPFSRGSVSHLKSGDQAQTYKPCSTATDRQTDVSAIRETYSDELGDAGDIALNDMPSAKV